MRAAGRPEVETSGGRVRGVEVGGVRVFRGLPYAASTAGAGRFRPPAPVTPWTGTREAAHFGPSAPQVPAPPDPLFDWYGAIEPTSEDCLSLNVFTPGTDDARRPVLVWIHGGAWAGGAGSAPGWDGMRLARDGGVVVVTVNHRLTAFGYLRLDQDDERFADAGAAGLLDLVAALRWVREHAEAFGGDPDCVTIVGQSGGAAKVSALMAMPAAHGLFHRAVAQSCSGSLRVAEPNEGQRMADGLARQLGLSSANGVALQAVPVERIVGALAGTTRSFRPVIDGRNLDQHPFDPSAPAISSDVPLLIGTTANETTLFLAADMRNFSLDLGEVRRRLERFLGVGPGDTDRILEAYRADRPTASPSDLLVAVTTDYHYTRNTLTEAVLQADSASAPTYAYRFDWRTPVRGGVLGTPHTAEVPFVFGTTEAAAGLLGRGPDLEPMTRTVMATWVAFARTGDPNNPHLPPWPRYDATGRRTMLLGLESSVSADPGGVARSALDDVPPFDYSRPVSYPLP
ncbi:MAG: carboxylesterase family protein [Lapillicoccus sp.]